MLDGDWHIKAEAGKVFFREHMPIKDVAPPMLYKVRGWDLAGTEKELTSQDPDYTATALGGVAASDKLYWILEVIKIASAQLALTR